MLAFGSVDPPFEVGQALSKEDLTTISRARWILFRTLRDSRLEAQGRFSDRHERGWRADDWHEQGWQEHSIQRTSIPMGYWEWEGVDWKTDSVKSFHGEFIGVVIEESAFQALFADQFPKFQDRAAAVASTSITEPSSTTRTYTTPYLDLIDEAIRQFGPNGFAREKKQTIVHWLQQHEIEGEKLSAHLAEVMATLLRPPKMKKGRAARSKKH